MTAKAYRKRTACFKKAGFFFRLLSKTNFLHTVLNKIITFAPNNDFSPLKFFSMVKLHNSNKKLCLLLCATLFATTTITAEVLLNENFEYENLTLIDNGTWVAYGSNPNAPIQLVDPALTYEGYQNTGKGKSVSLGKESSGADAQYIFSKAITEGSLYYAALINVAEAPTEKASTIIALLQPGYSGTLEAGKSGTEFALLSAQHTADGQYKLQISRNNTTVVAAEAACNYSTTYLIVVKYTIVDGSNNDEVRLYINQTTATEPITADALFNLSSGSNLNTSRGFWGLELCQPQTSTKNAAVVTLDAVRVATTWAELFDQGTSGGDEPNPTTPAITAPASVEFGSDYYVLTGEPHTQTITVKGSDLEDDVTFAVNCDQITLSATSAAKEQVMSEDGFELTLTLTATGAACEPKLTIGSTNATTVEVPIAWTVAATIDVDDIAALRTAAAAANLDDEPLFRLTNPVAVSYQDGANYIYLQDDKGGIRMKDEHGLLAASTFATGTKLASGLFGTVADNFGYYFIPYRDIAADGTAEVSAVTATLAEIDADKSAYVDRLVRVEHVQFAQTGTFGTAQVPFNQNGTEAKLRLFGSVADIAGQAIPTQATVVGISTSTSALLIAPRAWSDITPEENTGLPTKEAAAAVCYANDGTLYVEHANAAIAVYNLTGVCVAKAAPANRTAIALPQGVYAVKIDGKTHKVIVK